MIEYMRVVRCVSGVWTKWSSKGDRVREVIEGRGCSILFPTALLAGFFAHRRGLLEGKALLRKAAVRTRAALEEAIGIALSAGHARGRYRILRLLRLPAQRLTIMRTAVSR